MGGLAGGELVVGGGLLWVLRFSEVFLAGVYGFEANVAMGCVDDCLVAGWVGG